MLKTFICALALLASSLRPLLAQESPMLKYAQTLTARDLSAHLYFLADDLLEGRETGTRGMGVAAKYIEADYKRLGLMPGNSENGTYFQKYMVVNSKIDKMNIKIASKQYEYRKDFFTFDLGLLPTAIVPAWTCVGYGIKDGSTYDNFKGQEMAGKNVIMFAGSPDVQEKGMPARKLIRRWFDRIPQMSKASAIWVILPDSVYQKLNIYGRKSSTTVKGMQEKGVPTFIISEAMGNSLLKGAKTSVETLKAKIAPDGTVPKLDFKKLKFAYNSDKVVEELPAYNVMGFLEGTDKRDEVVVITAHFDHLGIENGLICNGADDDGSGTVTVLELAEAFTKAADAGYRPRRSILFMNVSGEEKGLLGSDYYTMHPVYPLEKTIVDLNIDMIGRIDPKYEVRADSANYTYVIGADKLSTDLNTINEEMNNTHSKLTFDYTYNDEADPNQFYYRSDHYNFARNGIPVIFYFTGTHKDYHKPTDDVEKINFNKMVTIGRQVFYTAWELANRENRIVVDKK